MTVYASRGDYALFWSRFFRLHLRRLGDVGADKLVVLPDMDTIDATAANVGTLFGLFKGHSYVAERPAILNDLFQLIRYGAPPDDRSDLDKRQLAGLPYWVFRRHRR